MHKNGKIKFLNFSKKWECTCTPRPYYTLMLWLWWVEGGPFSDGRQTNEGNRTSATTRWNDLILPLLLAAYVISTYYLLRAIYQNCNCSTTYVIAFFLLWLKDYFRNGKLSSNYESILLPNVCQFSDEFV